MKSIQIKLKDRDWIDIERLDIRMVSKGIAIGTDQSVHEHIVKPFILDVYRTYGSSRTIQVLTPGLADAFDYSVFVDMTRWEYKRDAEQFYISSLGMLYFADADAFSIPSLRQKVIDSAEWFRAKGYYADEL